MMNINEEQVRKHAYQIWESEGRPQNQATRHWEMAQKMAATQNQLENQDRSNTSKAKTRSAKASSAEKLSVKEPSIKNPSVKEPDSKADLAAASKKIKTRQKQNQKIEKADAIASTDVVKDVIKTEIPPVNSQIGV